MNVVTGSVGFIGGSVLDGALSMMSQSSVWVSSPMREMWRTLKLLKIRCWSDAGVERKGFGFNIMFNI